jgi:hypothetical protein
MNWCVKSVPNVTCARVHTRARGLPPGIAQPLVSERDTCNSSQTSLTRASVVIFFLPFFSPSSPRGRSAHTDSYARVSDEWDELLGTRELALSHSIPEIIPPMRHAAIPKPGRPNTETCQ